MHPYLVRDLDTLRQALADSTREVRTVPHSVRSVAEAAGTSHGTVGNIMTGAQERVSEEVGRRIAEVLGADFDALFVLDASMSSDEDSEVRS
jgi:transcriptional regulator with XRE-family HTH domain